MNLNGDSEVVSIFYFWNEVLNPAGHLHGRAERKSRALSFFISFVCQYSSLTTMMVSLRATISGFTLSRSIMIFSFPLMKPHFGAEDETKSSDKAVTLCPQKQQTRHLSSFSSHHLRSCQSPFPEGQKKFNKISSSSV